MTTSEQALLRLRLFNSMVGPRMLHLPPKIQSVDRTVVASTNYFLHFQRRRADPVGEYFTLSVEVCERGSILDVHHHERVPYHETAVDSATTTQIGQHSEESVLVDDVLTFTQAFRAILVRRTKTVVCPSPCHSTLNNPGVRLSYILRARQHGSVAVHRRPDIDDVT